MTGNTKRRKKPPANLLTRVVNALPVLACGGDVVLTDIALRMKYVDGHETDELAGWNYTAILTRNGFLPVTIKTDETAPALEPEDLDALVQAGETVLIKDAPGFALQVYADDRRNVTIAVKAEKVIIDIVREEK